jgi:hypothetical protein
MQLHIWISIHLKDDRVYEHLHVRARSLRGVIYHGLAPNPELRAALRNMHFLTYPCTFAETGCLAAIEANGRGVPLDRPSLGALPETTAGFARIYPSNQEAHIAVFLKTWRPSSQRRGQATLLQSKSQQTHYADVYNWTRRRCEWRKVINGLAIKTIASEPAM